MELDPEGSVRPDRALGEEAALRECGHDRGEYLIRRHEVGADGPTIAPTPRAPWVPGRRAPNGAVATRPPGPAP
jgi:hypothetical protein